MKHKIVVPTGYMGSGSSAVTNLVSEIDGFDVNNGSFEHVFLHCPNGVFDLEDKLLRGNTALRSDEAIHSFLSYMRRLHYEPNYWFSGYREKLTPKFYQLCCDFIDALDPVGVRDSHWYYQEDVNKWSYRARWHFNRLLAGITKQTYVFGRPVKPLDYYDVRLAFPEAETFYAAARAFLGRLFDELGYSEHHLVLDQLLVPYNLWRIENYFGDELRVFVVSRDPRDVFLLNKYHWMRDGNPVPFPTDPEVFCRVYEAMRRTEVPVDDPRILRLRFEDLIYRYEETLPKIYAFLDADPAAHIRKGTILRPEISINNTQLFRRDPAYAAETAVIAERLAPYLYDFPEAPDGTVWEIGDVF